RAGAGAVRPDPADQPGGARRDPQRPRSGARAQPLPAGMKRVVVTGLGAVTPVGLDAPSTWAAMLEGQSGVGKITLFDASEYPVQIAGEVKGFDATGRVEPKELRRMDRYAQLGVIAAQEAFMDAGLAKNGLLDEIGVVFGSAAGGLSVLLEQQRILQERGLKRVSPTFIQNMLTDTASGHIAIALGLRGPNMAVVSACATDMGAPAEGEGAVLTMRRALRKAEIEPERVDYINAHGTGTPMNDKFETDAIHRVFGKHAEKLAVSSTKSMTGHMMGASGAVEAVVCALTIRDQVIAPTINLQTPDPECDPDYV